MTLSVLEKDRHIFPRWRSFRATADLGELSLPAVQVENDTSGLDLSLARGIAEWKGDPSLWRGLDLLGTAIVAGRLDDFPALVSEIVRNPLAPQTARNILKRTQAPGPAQLLLPEYDKIPDLFNRAEIRLHRSRLVSTPGDAIEWVELARAYTIAGVNDKARRAILAALQLAPNNRFVLRSAARFLIHVGERDRAHSLLSRSDVIKEDPWILASEIAISGAMGKSSKFWRSAKEAMERDFAPSELTELSCALGSSEAEGGNRRGARRLLRRALADPNENSIAQIQWLNRSHLGEAIDVSNANPPLLHEATAWASYYKGEFGIARDEALRWLSDQPFASAPAILSSYILCDIFGDSANGKMIAEAGLRSNPDDMMLLNNLAVCLLELGELTEAQAVLSKFKIEDQDKRARATLKATLGMFEFRRGDLEAGRKLYLEAVQDAKEWNGKQTAARAAIHLLQEEIVAETDFVEEAVARVKEYRDLEGVAEIAWLLNRAFDLIESDGAAKSPGGQH